MFTFDMIEEKEIRAIKMIPLHVKCDFKTQWKTL